MAHQDRLAGALHAIEPQEEWRGIAVGTAVPLCVDAETLEQEGNAVLRLVIDDLRHDCGDDGSRNYNAGRCLDLSATALAKLSDRRKSGVLKTPRRFDQRH